MTIDTGKNFIVNDSNDEQEVEARRGEGGRERKEGKGCKIERGREEPVIYSVGRVGPRAHKQM